jgi:hypothetical protein
LQLLLIPYSPKGLRGIDSSVGTISLDPRTHIYHKLKSAELYRKALCEIHGAIRIEADQIYNNISGKAGYHITKTVVFISLLHGTILICFTDLQAG